MIGVCIHHSGSVITEMSNWLSCNQGYLITQAMVIDINTGIIIGVSMTCLLALVYITCRNSLLTCAVKHYYAYIWEHRINYQVKRK